MLDSDKRLTIPAALLAQSNLKGEKKVYITIEEGDILFIPYTSDLKGRRIFDVRSIDAKGRIALPPLFVKISSEWTAYLLDGEIWATRDVL